MCLAKSSNNVVIGATQGTRKAGEKNQEVGCSSKVLLANSKRGLAYQKQGASKGHNSIRWGMSTSPRGGAETEKPVLAFENNKPGRQCNA